jgi:CxxC-x17-CxxC domain-containing protein
MYDNRPNRSQNNYRSDRGGYGSRDSHRNQMHDAVCAECGDNCKVPFMPTSGKPVYCNSCFGQNGGNDRDSHRDSRSFNDRKPSHSNRGGSRDNHPPVNYKKQFQEVNSKLDSILKILSDTDTKKVSKKTSKKKVVDEAAELVAAVEVEVPAEATE